MVELSLPLPCRQSLAISPRGLFGSAESQTSTLAFLLRLNPMLVSGPGGARRVHTLGRLLVHAESPAV